MEKETFYEKLQKLKPINLDNPSLLCYNESEKAESKRC